jgi:hypothetical protein
MEIYNTTGSVETEDALLLKQAVRSQTHVLRTTLNIS